MSRYGTWRPVARYQPGGSAYRAAFTPRRLILHTAVSNATPSMYSFFAVSGRATPHFYVGRDGECEQFIDTSHGSSANLDGNHDCITVETWDGYGTGWTGSNVPPWTDAQVEALARLAAWCCTEHGLPLERLPSSLPGTRGVGWHRLGIDGSFPSGLLAGRVAGGERWSSSTGKVCPGDNRIRQVEDIINRARQVVDGTDEGDDMPTADEIADAVWRHEIGGGKNRQAASEHLLKARQSMKGTYRLTSASRDQLVTLLGIARRTLAESKEDEAAAEVDRLDRIIAELKEGPS